MTEPTPNRIARCRMTDRYGGLCTAEAVDPNGEILICARHLALALEMVSRQMQAARKR